MSESAKKNLTGESQSFDLILVAEYFRSIPYYTSIIKYLSSEFSIAVYRAPVDASTTAKNEDAQEEFISLCEKLGAKILPEDSTAATALLLVPQRPYSDAALNAIRTRIKARKVVGALAFAWAGMEPHDSFIETFSIKKLYAIDKNLIAFLLQNRGKPELYGNLEVTEVGLPYAKYPVVDDFSAEYLLAMPTPFSFPHEEDKWKFLETALAIFKQIPVGARIVHKPHNGLERDQFASRHLRAFLRGIGPLAGLMKWLRHLLTPVPTRPGPRRLMARLYTAYLYERLLVRTIPMARATGFEQMAMEMFLPFVRCGVIGGLSNTIWGTLYFKLPFYNCVDLSIQNRADEERLYGKKDPTQLLDLNLRYFAVPYCESKLTFDTTWFGLIPDACRNGDLIAQVRADVKAALDISETALQS
jgi:hypothetical protein